MTRKTIKKIEERFISERDGKFIKEEGSSESNIWRVWRWSVFESSIINFSKSKFAGKVKSHLIGYNFVEVKIFCGNKYWRERIEKILVTLGLHWNAYCINVKPSKPKGNHGNVNNSQKLFKWF